MTDAEIHDELATMLAAGHETTATTLAWAIERLRRHPALLGRLVEEADAGGRDLRVATVLELQRVRPVVPGTGRYVVKPFRLGNYVIPPGHGILISATLTHEDPRLFPDRTRSTRIGSSGSARTRSRGFPSAADAGAVPGRRSSTWRWTWCCGRCSARW